MTNTHTGPDDITLPLAICAGYVLNMTYIFAPEHAVFTPAFLDSTLTHVTAQKLGHLTVDSFVLVRNLE